MSAEQDCICDRRQAACAQIDLLNSAFQPAPYSLCCSRRGDVCVSVGYMLSRRRKGLTHEFPRGDAQRRMLSIQLPYAASRGPTHAMWGGCHCRGSNPVSSARPYAAQEDDCRASNPVNLSVGGGWRRPGPKTPGGEHPVHGAMPGFEPSHAQGPVPGASPAGRRRRVAKWFTPPYHFRLARPPRWG